MEMDVSNSKLEAGGIAVGREMDVSNVTNLTINGTSLFLLVF
jgi:hypothetical protein